MVQTIKMHGWPLRKKHAITTLNIVGKWALWVHRMRQIACWRGCFLAFYGFPPLSTAAIRCMHGMKTVAVRSAICLEMSV